MARNGMRGARLRRRFRALARAVAILVLAGSVALADAPARRPPAARDLAFAGFVASLWPMAEILGVSRKTFNDAFAGVAFDPKVVAATRRQAEFTIPVRDYIAAAVSPDRIARGRVAAQTVSSWLDEAGQMYGVDPAILTGIWGLESDFGSSQGTFDVIRSLATLAFVRFRDTYFRDELLAALMILQNGDIAPRAMVGSWAGAMGQTQFMPSSFLEFAVDFTNDGRRDVWTSKADAIGSTARFLAANGWKRGLPWGFEVTLPPGFTLRDADSAAPAAFSDFAARGVVRADGKPLPAEGVGRLLMPTGLKGPIFLVTANFDVIKTYNSSTVYALAVALLGDEIVSRSGLRAPWPPSDRALGPNEVRNLQSRLKSLGYDPGAIDGMVGDTLRAAVRKYQERNGLPPDGYADVALLKRIESGQ
ncbi:lytic murein transglycosylase [Roseiarcus fermentans]|uniref:Lytic murein transglycosylase n=1 Tax=Roseiarcus fermentans TaxID=1473586 RepID=A0A366FNV3_9HYPH|nr:lytic murein transglycosylase [Roseiarcus fermentans]RBP16373.1 lytic murein transglycosylase [Roseiarcus fermentans]